MVAVSLKKKIFFKQKTAYEMCPCDWSSDVCSSDLFLEQQPPRTVDKIKAIEDEMGRLFPPSLHRAESTPNSKSSKDAEE